MVIPTTSSVWLFEQAISLLDLKVGVKRGRACENAAKLAHVVYEVPILLGKTFLQFAKFLRYE